MCKLIFKLLMVAFLLSSANASAGYILSPDKKIKVLYNNNNIKIYSSVTKTYIPLLSKIDGNITFLVVDDANELLASCSDKNIINIWSIKSGALLQTIKLRKRVISSIFFYKKNNSIVVRYKTDLFEAFSLIENNDDILISSNGLNEEKTNSNAVSSIQEFMTIDVMYGTNRAKTGKKEPNNFFGKKPSVLSYGMCKVSLPITHKAGEIERPSWYKFEFKEDPRKHVMIQNLKVMNKTDFNAYMKYSFTSMNKKDILIFIHGFSNQFDESVRRAGQIAYDLDFPGIAMTYSWPSQGSFSVSNYEKDEIFSNKSIPYLKKFLLDVIKNAPNQKINIIAHSMGNRVLVNAIADIENQSEGTVFNQVILAAPDVNAKIFKEDILPKMQGKAKKITLYASSEDKALMVSRILHNQSRLGESGKYLTVINGIDTIDSTGIDPSTMGHSYFSSTKTMLDDIKILMLNDIEPSNRQLKTMKEEDISYWKILLNKTIIHDD